MPAAESPGNGRLSSVRNAARLLKEFSRSDRSAPRRIEHRVAGGGWLVKWTDFAAPLAVGGVWLSLYVWQLRGRPLLLRASPEDLEAAHGHG